MKTDPIAERARQNAAEELEALATLICRPPLDDVQLDLSAALRIAAAIDIVIAALTTESRPEGLERDRHISAREMLAREYDRMNLASEAKRLRINLGCELKAEKAAMTVIGRLAYLEVFAEEAGLATPHPQTDAPASGEVEAMRQACIAAVRAEQRYEGSDFPVCNSIVCAIEAITTPSEGARDSALEEAAKVADNSVRRWQEGLGKFEDSTEPNVAAISLAMLIAQRIRALRSAKPEQAGAGFVMVPVEPTEAMIEACNQNLYDSNPTWNDPVEIWSAMIAAASQGQNSGETSRG